MQEIEFTKEDEYCIRNFGYNTVGDYEDLKQLEDKEHLIIEELEYRLQQKENIIKEVREDLDKTIEFCTNEADGTANDKICRITINYLKHLKETLEKENKQ